MADLPFPGGTPLETIHKLIRVCLMVKECIDNDMSKDETQRYLQRRYHFTRQDINKSWDLERYNPDSFRLHNERIRERNARTCERVASSSPREGTSAILGEQEQQCLPPRRSEFWQRSLNTLSQIQSNTEHLNTLGQIKSNTDQMVTLLSDGHGFGRHPSAARPLKRQRDEEAEEGGGDEEGEKILQEKNEGGDEEGEKLQENERAGDEEGEKLQKNERGETEEEEEEEEEEGKLQENGSSGNEEEEMMQD